MKLKDYIAKLQEIAKDHPNAKVIYAADDEGNNFSSVQFGPAVGNFDGANFDNSEEAKVNAVCLN
jgi:hypothetical protein